jgi:transaldolase
MCLQAQRLYEEHDMKTQVLPASLTSTDEIMALAGVHSITIAPGLLQELSTSSTSSNATKSLFDEAVDANESHPLISYLHDRARYQIDFTRSGNGEGERKLSQVSTSKFGKFEY